MHNREIYLHLPNGMGRAKLPIGVGKLEAPSSPATARNWRTVLELQKFAAPYFDLSCRGLTGNPRLA